MKNAINSLVNAANIYKEEIKVVDKLKDNFVKEFNNLKKEDFSSFAYSELKEMENTIKQFLNDDSLCSFLAALDRQKENVQHC